MQEKTLFRISVMVIIVGVIFLFFYSETLNLKPNPNLKEINSGEPVKLKGIISKITQKDKVAFIEMESERVEKNNIILFPDQEIFLKEGDSVEISGTVEEYNNQKEVIGNKVVLKSG